MREKQDTIVNPIYEWDDADIWEYIKMENVKTNPLYERGYKRVGCIGCPLATYSQKIKEFADYPRYKKAYINAFQKMCDIREAEGKTNKGQWANGEAVFNWWIEEYKHNVKGQLTFNDI
jgi:phosphoadenosine phosphosulfate reductase